MDTLGVPQRRVPPLGPAPTHERLGFEFKMRKRRFARCLLRADLALEDRCLEEARAALDEARDLRPDSAELAALERRLQEIEAAPPFTVIEQKDVESPPAPERTWSWPVFILLAGLLGSGLIAMWFWGGSRRAQPVETPVVRAAGPGTEQAVPLEHPRTPAIRIEQETIAAPQVVPRIATEEQLAPQPLAPPVAETRPAERPEAPPVAVTRSIPPTPARLPPSVSGVVTEELPRTASAVPAAPPPAPPAAVPPVSRAVEQSPPTAVPESAIAAAAPPPPPAAPAVASSSTIDDSERVRAVLARYEMAYSSLDAAAASAVWPAVNRGALARAFRDLNSQQVSLGACDVKVQGGAARATCSGSASWEPRVGGGLRTEARRWDFELRKAGDAWRIERAIAQ